MLSKNQIKEIQSLQLKKQRDVKSLFLVEGVRTVLEIFESKPQIIDTVFATADFIKKYGANMNTLNLEYHVITDDELKKISLQASPNSVIATCKYFEATKETFDPLKEFALYLDDIRDPGNFGTIIRLAAWFGISTVYCSPASCDVYNPKVIQSTMGAFLRVNVIYKELAELLKEKPIAKIYGAVLNGKNLYSERLGNGLIVIGNEANGISDANLQLLTHKITIPSGQEGGTESLNAAMAASIITSEFYKQLKDSK